MHDDNLPKDRTMLVVEIVHQPPSLLNWLYGVPLRQSFSVLEHTSGLLTRLGTFSELNLCAFFYEHADPLWSIVF